MGDPISNRDEEGHFEEEDIEDGEEEMLNMMDGTANSG